jgi:peptidoglycan/LPS O-acetylase OafA/YrhL
MARLRAPAVAFAFLLFIAAGLAGIVALLFGVNDGSIGAAWALIVFLAVVVALVIVAGLRANNKSRAEQP